MPSERRQFLLLLLATLTMSAFEVAGVGAILPFLSVVSDPSLFETQPLLRGFRDILGLETPQAATVGLGVAVFLLMSVGMGVRALVTYLQFRFALMRSYSLASRLLHGYLSQDWAWHLSRNSAEFSTALLSEIDQVVRESILPAVLLISNALVVIMLASLIFLVAPGVAIGATGLLTLVYAVVVVTFRRRLTRVGRARVEANGARFLAVQEIAGGLKELKVLGLEQQSLARFRGPAEAFAQTQTTGQVIGRLPRFAIEGAVYGGFVLMVLVMVLWRGDAIADLMPLFGLLGMAATRLFPALQNVYLYVSQIQFSATALNHLVQRLSEAARRPLLAPAAPLPLRTQLALRDVTFTYPGAERPTLQNLSLTIPAMTTVGFVGGTGAGKTTIVDLLLGLLSPDKGAVLVDGSPLDPDRLRAWQRNVGYVPQQIFLLDDSIAANIAFGGAGPLDVAAMERAARLAQLHDFVGTLPQGYGTSVGERGLRLSGGQRQRIGIARALYRDPDVLVLDEATSALDTLTEQVVMEALRTLAGSKTIVMIAHRLSTIRHCDTIFLLEGGRITATGRHEELLSTSERFREMSSA